MGADYRIDPERRVVFAICRDVLGVEDMERLTERMRSDPMFKQDFQLVVDLCAVTSISSTFDAIQRYASDRRNDPFSSGSRRAIVAPQNLTFGIARMYEALRDENGLLLKIFRSMPEALKWLELDVT